MQQEYSLVDMLNGSLALVSLFLAFFAIWLSWQFYKQSRGESNRTSDAVTRIETTVTEVQSSVTQIVEKAVESWTSSGAAEEADATDRIDDMFSNLKSEMLQIVEDSSQRSEILKILNEKEDLAGELWLHSNPRLPPFSSFMATRRPKTKAVLMRQESVKEKDGIETGKLIITITRDINIATAVFHFHQSFSDPKVEIGLIEAPNHFANFSYMAALDQMPDRFNVHLNANSGFLLPAGEYLMTYAAHERTQSVDQ